MSYPRNPRIANALFDAGMIENWGIGTVRILEWCSEAGAPPPEFASRNGTFMATLWPTRTTDAGDRIAVLLKHVSEHGTVTRREYVKVANVPERTAARDLQHLVEQGILAKEGKGRGVRYVLGKRAT